MNYSLKYLCVVLMLVSWSCMSPFLQSEHTEKYSKTLDPLIGMKAREYVYNMYGTPVRKFVREDGELWVYTFQIDKSEYLPLDKYDGEYPDNSEYLSVWFDGEGVLKKWHLAVLPTQPYP